VYTKSREICIRQTNTQCSSYSFQASLLLCHITDAHLHVTDTRIILTIDENNWRAEQNRIEYVRRVEKDTNVCEEHNVRIKVSSNGVVDFLLHLHLCCRQFSHTSDAPTPCMVENCR
jgi:hypothetical protein